MKTERLYCLDNLKTFLIILVVVAHCALTYGNIGHWYYEERTSDTITNLTILLFVAIVQSFSMGLFFFISGYFAQISIDKYGKSKFLKSRLVKIGIPLLVYMLIFNRTLDYLGVLKYNNINYFDHFFFSIKNFNISPGITWFLEALFLFNMFHFLFSFGSIKNIGEIKLNNRNIIFFVIIISTTIFLIRIKYPMLTFILSLPVDVLLKYICLYLLGAIAFRNQWLDNLSTKLFKLNVKILIILFVMVPIVILLGGVMNGNLGKFLVGATWQNCFYSFWETYLGVVLIIVLLYYFKNKMEYTNTIMNRMARSAYAVFIFHAFVLILVGYFLSNFRIYMLLKFLILSILSVPVSFLISSYIVKIPLVNKVL